MGKLNKGESNVGKLIVGEGNMGKLNKGESNVGKLNVGEGNVGKLNEGNIEVERSEYYLGNEDDPFPCEQAKLG